MPSARECDSKGQGGHSSDEFLLCAGLSAPTPASPDLQAYLDAAGAPPPSDPQHGWVSVVGMAMLRLNRMIYGANNYPGGTPNEDCATVDIGAGQNLGALTLQTSQQALGLTAAGLTAVAQTGINISGTAASVLGSVASEIPIAGAIISVFTSIFGIFQIHAQRVQAEKDLLCNVVGTYNAMAAQIESSLQAGQITPLQAAQLLANTGGALIQRMRTFVAYKPGDGPWGYDIILRAMVAYNANEVYPAMGGGFGQLGSIVGVPTKTLFYIGGGLILAKLLGVI